MRPKVVFIDIATFLIFGSWYQDFVLFGNLILCFSGTFHTLDCHYKHHSKNTLLSRRENFITSVVLHCQLYVLLGSWD